MKTAMRLFFFLLVFNASWAFSQSTPLNNPVQSPTAIDDISAELTKISKFVQTLNQTFKEFLEKSGKIGGVNFTEKQQKILLGFEVLNRAETRLATLQKFQIELVEKQVTVRTRIIQIDQEIKPESIERGTAFIGTTKTDEIRENRRRALGTERTSLQGLLDQIQSNLSQTNDELQEAQSLVLRLRRALLPQIEREISDL